MPPVVALSQDDITVLESEHHEVSPAKPRSPYTDQPAASEMRSVSGASHDDGSDLTALASKLLGLKIVPYTAGGVSFELPASPVIPTKIWIRS